MTRALLIVAIAVAMVLGSPVTSVAPAAAGEPVCDVKASPDKFLTRGQLAAFLFRALQ